MSESESETNQSLKYYQDSRCYDEDYRCTIECEYYGKRYTGETSSCFCDCTDFYVSICTGHNYTKAEVDK
jgi:hypothetical protein